jgi:hypothetical protein
LQVVDANNGLFAPAANAVGLTVNGAERMRVDSGANFSRVIPGGSALYPDFACRAWVNFNGTNGAIRAGGNATVVRTTTGTYTISFVSPMPNANYCAVAESGDTGNNTLLGRVTEVQSQTATSFVVKTFGSGNGALGDWSYAAVSVHR